MVHVFGFRLADMFCFWGVYGRKRELSPRVVEGVVRTDFGNISELHQSLLSTIGSTTLMANRLNCAIPRNIAFF